LLANLGQLETVRVFLLDGPMRRYPTGSFLKAVIIVRENHGNEIISVLSQGEDAEFDIDSIEVIQYEVKVTEEEYLKKQKKQ
jgi:hypothetical protein